MKVVNLDGTVDDFLTGKINDMQDVLTVKGQVLELLIKDADADQFAGKKIVVALDATIDTTKNLADYLVEGALPNTATLSYTNDPTKDINDTAKVTPPGEDPTPKKDVNGQDSLVLGSLEQLFTYHVNATVPADISKFTKYVLTDNLEDILVTSQGQVKVKVNGLEDSTLTGLVKVEADGTVANNLVTLDIPMATLENYKGKNIELSIEARIKDGVTAEELAKYASQDPANSIPNTANLALTDNPDEDKKTNTVPVTPPNGDTPDINKTVNNVNEYQLETLKETHTYKVTSNIPANTTGYQKVVIADKLESILEATSVKVFVADVELTADQIATYGSLVNNNGDISYTIDKNFDQLAGKQVAIVIEAKVKDTATAEELKPYLNQGYIPNKASLTFNDEPAKEAEVKVLPPSEVPTLDKKVNGEDEVTITNLTDALTYTMDITVPETTRDITKIVLEDTFLPIFKLGTNPTVKVMRGTAEETALTTEAQGKLTVSGQTVSLQIVGAEAANKFAGTTIRVTVPATIDTTKNLADYLVEGALPNTAKLSYTNDPNKDIDDTAKVTPPGEDPTPKKDVNGKPELALGTKDQVFTYHVGATVPSDIQTFTKYVLVDNLEDVLVTSKAQVVVKVGGVLDQALTDLVTVTENGTDKNIVTLNIPLATLQNYRGKYIEVSIEANVDKDADLSKYEDNKVPNQANLTVGDNPDQSYDTEIVPVTPPNDEEPTIKKEVSKADKTGMTDAAQGITNLELAAKDEIYTYHVSVEVPQNTNGFTKFIIEDTLEDVLTVGNVQVKLSDGTAYAGPQAVTEGQKVSLDLSSVIKDYAGKTVTLEINANIKADADLTEYVGEKVPNKATLNFNDKPMESNEVTVTPPGETPTPKKDVNGKEAENLGLKTQEFTYNVYFDVPTNVTGFTKINLTDDLEDVLEVVSTKVTVAGVEDQTLSGQVNVTTDGTNVVTLDITDNFDQLAGKRVNLAITAKVKADADLSGYTDNTIPNKATLTLNDDSAKSKDTNEVPVTPPNDEVPTIEKKVGTNDGTTGNNMSKDELKLDALTTPYIYHVDVKVPANVSGYEQIKIEDTLEKVLTLGDVKILVDNVESTELTGLVVKNENTVTFEINNAGKADADKYDFKQLAGKTITMVINANIKDGADLSAYINGSVPNTATLTFNNKPSTSNEVLVTPPGETPSLDKKVNGSDEVTIENLTDDLSYTMDIEVPMNTKDITKIVLEDTFLPIFKLGTPTVEVKKAGQVDANLTDAAKQALSVDGQKASLQIVGATEANKYAGTVITVTVPATIDTTKNLADYLEAGKLPNTATLSYNNDPTKDIDDTAKVTPPGENPTPKKDVDGKPSLVLGAQDQVFTYHVNATVPSDVSKFTKYVLTDDLEDILTIIGTQVKVNGVVDSTAQSKLIVGDNNLVTLDLTEVLGNYKGKNIEVSIQAKIKEGVTDEELAKYATSTPANSIPNVASLALTDNPDEDKKTDNVPVTPPNPDEPGVEKTVSREDGTDTTKDNLELKARSDKFIYNVNTEVPTNTNGYTQIKLEDTLVDVLKVEKARVLVDGVEDKALVPVINGQVVSVEITDNFKTYAGKTISLEITSSIVEGADLSAYVNQVIPNEATLTFNGTPKTSNKVTVTPPGETPTGDKPEIFKEVSKLDGSETTQGNLDLVNTNEVYKYSVHTDVASNVANYKSIKISDTLESVLSMGNVSVLVDGVEDANLIAKLVKSGQTVSLEILEGFGAYAGKRITLVIEANITEGADLSAYAKQAVPNKATLVFNNEPAVETNTVTVTPPGEEPGLDKKVNGQDEVTIENLTDELTYTMDVTVPANTRDITKVLLTDEFLPIFKLNSSPTVEVKKADGSIDTTLTAQAQNATSVSGQTLKLAILGAEEANKFAGTTITVTVKATIDQTKDLASYLEAGALPNTAKLAVNDNPNSDITDKAKVTPPGETPAPVKDVNGYDSLILGKLDQTFTYNITSKVPANINGFTKYLLTDDLEDILVTAKEQVSVKVNGSEDTSLLAYVSVENNNVVKLDIPMNVLENYRGKLIVLSIDARIKDGVTTAELDAYKDGAIPNTANLTVGDNPGDSYNTNTVPVTPPKGDEPTIDKVIVRTDGSQLNPYEINLNSLEENFKYYVNVNIAKNVNGYKSIHLEDTLEDVLEVGDVKVVIDGNVERTDLTSKVKVDGQKVSLDITEEFEEFAGKTITLVIDSRLKDGITKDDLKIYSDHKVPNDAKLIFNNDPNAKISNKVFVDPPCEVCGTCEIPEEPTVETIEIPVTKLWKNADGGVKSDKLPDYVIVTLVKDGHKTDDSLILSSKNNWTNKFVELDKYQADGKTAVKYEVIEEKLSVVDGYETKITGDMTNGFTVTNTEKPKETPQQPTPLYRELVIHKTWANVDRAENYTATFNIYADGKLVRNDVKITGNDTVVIPKLPIFDESGTREIVYEVEEQALEGFKSIKTGSSCEGFAFTNYPVDKFGVILQKTDLDTKQVLEGATYELWAKVADNKDGDQAKLLAEEKAKLEKELAEIQASFDQANANNQNVNSSKEYIQELKNYVATATEEINKYKAEVDSLKAILETVSEAEKQDALVRIQALEEFIAASSKNVEDAKAEIAKGQTDLDKLQASTQDVAKLEARVEEIKLAIANITAEEEKLAAAVDTNSKLDENGYKLIGSYTTDGFGLIVFDEIAEGDYYFKEVNAPEGYKLDPAKHEFSVPNKDKNKTVVVNVTDEKEDKSVEVIKTWLDNDKHEAITVKLMADGVEVGSAQLSENNQWKHVFDGLKVTRKDGSLIDYSVVEVVPEGYTSKVVEVSGGFNVINTKTPEVPSNEPKDKYGVIDGIKHWKGDTEADRPDFISVNLVDVETGKVVQTKQVTKSTNWNYVFADVLLEDSSGKTYSYRIEEVPVDGYTTSYDGRNIINTKKPEKPTPETKKAVYGTIDGQKTWIGDKESDRPDSITINLIDRATGKIVASTEATKENGWKYSFDKVMILDENGKLYTYRVEEKVPAGYTASYNGYNIVNTKTPEPKPVPKPDPTPTPTPEPKPKPEPKPVPKPGPKPEFKPIPKPVPKPQPRPINKPVPNPITGDAGYGIYIASLALASIAFVIIKRKKKKDEMMQ